MKERIQALLEKGFTISDINREIVRSGSNYTGLDNWLKGKTNAPTTLNFDAVKKAVEVLEAN